MTNHAHGSADICAFFATAELTAEWLRRALDFNGYGLHCVPELLLINSQYKQFCNEMNLYQGSYYYYIFLKHISSGNYKPYSFDWIESLQQSGLMQQAEEWLDRSISYGSLLAIQAKVTLLLYWIKQSSENEDWHALFVSIERYISQISEVKQACAVYIKIFCSNVLEIIFRDKQRPSLACSFEQLSNASFGSFSLLPDSTGIARKYFGSDDELIFTAMPDQQRITPSNCAGAA